MVDAVVSVALGQELGEDESDNLEFWGPEKDDI